MYKLVIYFTEMFKIDLISLIHKLLQFTNFCTDLVAALAGLDMNDFSHFLSPYKTRIK